MSVSRFSMRSTRGSARASAVSPMRSTPMPGMWARRAGRWRAMMLLPFPISYRIQAMAEPVLSMAPAPVAIADWLRAAILSGALAAGTRVNQDRVAAEQGVSHIPVREALRRLEAEGLVTFAPRRGFFVARLSAEDAEELGEMRAALEALAIRLAAPRLTTADLEAAAAALAAADGSDDLR